MFLYSTFNGDISLWNVSNVANMKRMFYDAFNFNQDISSWDTTNVKDMREMFVGAASFNQPHIIRMWFDALNKPITNDD